MTPKELVKSWYENIDQHNFQANHALMSENHLFRNPMTPEPIGKDQHAGMMQMMTAALDGNHTIEHIMEENGWVAVIGKWNGTHVGEFEGIAPTGNPVEFSFADFFEITDGRITKEHLEMNPAAILAQIGSVRS